MSSIRSNSIGSISPQAYRQIDEDFFSIEALLDQLPISTTEKNEKIKTKSEETQGLTVYKFVFFAEKIIKELNTRKALKMVLQNLYQLDRFKSSKGLQSRARQILKSQVSLRHNQLEQNRREIAQLLARVLLGMHSFPQ